MELIGLSKKIMVREKYMMSNSFKQQGLHCLNKGEFVLSVLSIVWNVQDYVVAALTDLGNEYADWRQLYLCHPIWLQRWNIENPSLNLDRFWGATYRWRIRKDNIQSLDRTWTGFSKRLARGNIEGSGTLSDLDPMHIVEAWRDPCPKSNLHKGFIGDRYPLCQDLPARSFLKKGARYHSLGKNSSPELIRDPQ